MNLKEIGEKRQKIWKDTDLYKVKEDTSKPKFYVLDMFPYPSGAGLHVGHPKGYIASDTIARKKMLEGFNVLHPMGFDTFGLGTEQYAIDHKMKPQDVARENIENYIKQLEMFGTTYDRSRSVNTADPKYFKRTQRVFLQMYNHYYDEKLKKAMPITDPSKQARLAYVDYKPINRCPHCMTGLANEDLDDGKCERCGSEVEQKPMKQRVLRITKYAERLLEGLDKLNWEESMKDLERNWIGKSEGTQFDMSIDGMDEKFSVYTTRIDTVFGMSFVAIAPEHPLVDQITTKECKKDVEKYKEAAKKKSQLERTELQKEKTGVFCGAYAINPFNNEKVPVFVADYVLANYGTGVVMAVPAHDERDFEFAKKYNLPITQTIMPIEGIPQSGAEMRRTISAIVQRKSDNKFLCLKRKGFEWISPVIGGIEGNEDPLVAAEREVLEETGYQTKAIKKLGGLSESNFFAGNKNILRQRIDQPVLLELVDETPGKIDPEELEKHEAIRLTYEEAIAQTTHKDNLIGLHTFMKGESAFGEYGRLINSSNSVEKSVLILHGTEGNSSKNRYPRLKKQLEDKGYKVFVPDMPNSDLPDLDVRLDHLEQYKNQINEHSIIIGHSLGAPTAIQLLQKWNQPIERLILIAPTHTDINWDEYNQKVPSYNNEQIQKVSQTPTDWEQIQSLVHHIDAFFSEDDPYISMQVQDFYERDLGAKAQVFTDKGHFNLSGLKSEQFPELLQFIEKAYPKIEEISFNGLTSEEAIPAMQQRLEKNRKGGVKVNYKMQDRVFSRQRYRGEPFPILWAEDKESAFGPHPQPFSSKEKDEFFLYRRVDKDIMQFVKDLRKNQTSAEVIFWELVRNNKLGYKFRRQHPFGRYIVDFYCHELKLVVEIDGKIHDHVDNQKDDRFREEELQREGLHILRFRNEDIFNTPNKVIQSVLDFIQSPRPVGEGVGGEGKLIPIPLDEKELPLTLPDVDNYEPTGTEEGPLANITDWVNVTFPDGTKAKRETNTMPGRAGSSRYWLRYMDPSNDAALVGKERDAYRKNVDVYIGGAEHVTRHMIYGRFWQKFLFDIGVVSEDEPFKEYHYVGLIMGEDGRKMSKRRGNVVNPDDIINEYGADTLRAYEMFMGPFDQAIAWSTNGIKGIKKFLEKIIALKEKINDQEETNETKIILNQSIKKLTEDIDAFRFNTGVSQLMILVNHLTDCKHISRKTFEDLVILVSPYAPHLAEELREQLGNKYSIFTKATWPRYDETMLVADTVTIGVQVNGKVRGSITIDKEAEQEVAMQLAKADEKIVQRIVGEPKKVIYVKGKILNIVI